MQVKFPYELPLWRNFLNERVSHKSGKPLNDLFYRPEISADVSIPDQTISPIFTIKKFIVVLIVWLHHRDKILITNRGTGLENVLLNVTIWYEIVFGWQTNDCTNSLVTDESIHAIKCGPFLSTRIPSYVNEGLIIKPNRPQRTEYPRFHSDIMF